MKKQVCLSMLLAGVLTLGFGFNSFADYVEDSNFSAKRNYNERLSPEIEREKERLEDLKTDLENREAELEEIEEQYEAAKEVYEENSTSTNFAQYNKWETKYTQTQNAIASLKRGIETCEQKIETLNERLEEVTEDALEWTGYTAEGDEDITYVFRLLQKNGDWVLGATYRSWNPMLGGHWEYSSFVNDKLKISFYDGSDCLVQTASRASQYDTETSIFWDMPDGLEDGEKYYIKINNKKYGVYAYAYTDGDDYLSSDAEENDWDDLEYNWSDTEEDTQSSTSNGTVEAGVKSGYWMQDNVGWWIQYQDGTYLVNQWYQSPASGLWYYMGADGYMLTNTVTPDGYTVNADGVWVQ